MANIDPKENPFLLSEEGSGIDWQMLREKFTGRSNIFFNNENYGGTRGFRENNGWTIPNLLLDPSVKYRVFRGDNYASDILTTGKIPGSYNVGENLPLGIFFNQGVPLWSYASTPGQRYILATLGDKWGDRRGNAPDKQFALPDDWHEGGTELHPSKGDVGPNAVQEAKITIPSHEGGSQTTKGLSELKFEISNISRRMSNLANLSFVWGMDKEERKREKVSDDLYDEESIKSLDDYIERHHPEVAEDFRIETSDLRRSIKELDDKIDASHANKNQDAIDASYQRSDWRREKQDIQKEITDLKLESFMPVFKKSRDEMQAKELRDLITPERIELVKKHAKWLLDTRDFIRDTLVSDQYTPQQKAILTSNRGDYGSALHAYKNGLDSLDFLLSDIGYSQGNNIVGGGMRDNALGMALEEVSGKKVWSQQAKTDPDLFTRKVFAQLGTVLTGMDDVGPGLPVIGTAAPEGRFFPSYEINQTPRYLPLSINPASPNLNTLSPAIRQEDYFLDVTNNRSYVLGPTGDKVYVNPSDEASFKDAQDAWRIKGRFTGEPVVSDSGRITVGRLQWPHLGKEGAMYSESLPVTRYTAPWQSVEQIKESKYSIYDKLKPYGPDVEYSDLESNITSIQVGVGEERLKHIGERVTWEGQLPGKGVKLANGDTVIWVPNPKELIAKYGTSSAMDRDFLKTLFAIPEDKKSRPTWVKLEGTGFKEKRTQRTFQFPSGEFDLNSSARPSVLLKVNPDNPTGFDIVREWNNDPNEKGLKPIPTEAAPQHVYRDALIRFAREVVEPIAKTTLDDEIRKEYEALAHITDDKQRHELSIQQGTLYYHDRQNSYPFIKGYNTAEDFADQVLAGKKVEGLEKMLYAGSTARRAHPAELAQTVTPGYTLIKNLVDESTVGNPNYGKLGSNFGPQLEKLYDTGVMMEQHMDRYTKGFANKYANNPSFRAGVHNATIDAAGKYGPGLLMSAIAGVNIGSKMSEGMPFYKAAPAAAGEMGLGYLMFKYFDRYLGGVTMMGDATIEGANRRRAEEAAIRAERQPEIARSVANAMFNPIDKQKVDWNLLEKMEAERVKKVETKKKEEAYQQWLDKNDIFAKDVI